MYLRISTLTLALALANTPGPWCPRFHTIQGHFDPSGPLYHDGLWHVFPGGCAPRDGWCHYTSPDLIRWTPQMPQPIVGGVGFTGSVSVTESGIIALFPRKAQIGGLNSQMPIGDLSANNSWGNTLFGVMRKPDELGRGFRDPTRALKMPDGNWYVGVGSGYGGDTNSTTAPGKGTGCLAWFRAKSAALNEFEYMGCLLESGSTTGRIERHTVTWQPENGTVAFFECPDVFPLGAQKFLAIASLTQFEEGNYYTNEYFLGSISLDNKRFLLEHRAPLDYGQYYAARSGTGHTQGGNERRVMFATTGWQSPLHMDKSCPLQVHLIPRDLRLDVDGKLSISPIPEIHTLRVPGTRRHLYTMPDGLWGERTVANGSSLELQLKCHGTPAHRQGSTVGMKILATTDQNTFTVVGYDYGVRKLFVDHRNSTAGLNATDIVQTAPLGPEFQDDRIELYILVDNALVESFLNCRVVLSSWISEVMHDTNTMPNDRSVFVADVPTGVTCSLQSWKLQSLEVNIGFANAMQSRDHAV